MNLQVLDLMRQEKATISYGYLVKMPVVNILIYLIILVVIYLHIDLAVF